MRERRFQVVELGRWIAGLSRGQRQTCALAAGASQDRIHERGGAALAGLAGELNGIVDGRRRGDTIEVEQLKQREAQDVHHLGIQPIERAPGEHADDPIEGRLPSERAGGDLAGERPIALVAKGGARPCQRRGQIRGAAVDGPKRLVGRQPGRSNHGRN